LPLFSLCSDVDGLRIDIVDYYDPVMLIVGSRGLGQLKGYALTTILLFFLP
jgi:hypothetical protein